MGENGVCKRVIFAFMSVVLVMGLMPLLAYADERGVDAPDGAGALTVTANAGGATFEAQATDEGPQAGTAVKSPTSAFLAPMTWERATLTPIRAA